MRARAACRPAATSSSLIGLAAWDVPGPTWRTKECPHDHLRAGSRRRNGTPHDDAVRRLCSSGSSPPAGSCWPLIGSGPGRNLAQAARRGPGRPASRPPA
jgi:hypothetical protein